MVDPAWRVYRPEVGVSLVWGHDRLLREWEPEAASIPDRLRVLREARAMGCPTWASVEPVLDLDEAMAATRLLLPLVDSLAVGVPSGMALPYTPEALARWLSEWVALVEAHGVRWLVKARTRHLAQWPGPEDTWDVDRAIARRTP